MLTTALCLVVAALVAFEAYLLFVDQHGAFVISGRAKYDVVALADKKPVSQAFMMRGAGLESVTVDLGSDAFAEVRLRWVLWRGSVDYPPMTPAAEGEVNLALRPGRRRTTFNVVRDGSSHDRWYTLELLVVESTIDGVPGRRPLVSVLASHDNPDRGGVLFVNDVRQPGSLYLHAERRGRTLYRRFLAEAAPNLPAVLQVPAVQWAIAIVFHWAMIVFAYTVFSAGGDDSVREPS